jgi:hypothetical protein
MCFDKATGVLLSLEAPHPTTDHPQRILAEEFDQMARFTTDFPFDAKPGDVFPLELLHLPQSFDFIVE